MATFLHRRWLPRRLGRLTLLDVEGLALKDRTPVRATRPAGR